MGRGEKGRAHGKANERSVKMGILGEGQTI